MLVPVRASGLLFCVVLLASVCLFQQLKPQSRSGSSRAAAPAQPLRAQRSDARVQTTRKVLVVFGDSTQRRLRARTRPKLSRRSPEKARRTGLCLASRESGHQRRHHRGRRRTHGFGHFAQARDRAPGARRQRRPARPAFGRDAQESRYDDPRPFRRPERKVVLAGMTLPPNYGARLHSGVSENL